MAMARRKPERQPSMRVTTTDLPKAASHPFYRRLNELLREHGFDDFAQAQCASFYATPLASERVAFEEIDDGLWTLHFATVALARYDERHRTLRPIPIAMNGGAPPAPLLRA